MWQITSQERITNRGTKVHYMCEDYLSNNFDDDKHKKDFLAYCLFGQLKNQSLKILITFTFKKLFMVRQISNCSVVLIVLQNTMVSYQ